MQRIIGKNMTFILEKHFGEDTSKLTNKNMGYTMFSNACCVILGNNDIYILPLDQVSVIFKCSVKERYTNELDLKVRKGKKMKKEFLIDNWSVEDDHDMSSNPIATKIVIENVSPLGMQINRVLDETSKGHYYCRNDEEKKGFVKMVRKFNGGLHKISIMDLMTMLTNLDIVMTIDMISGVEARELAEENAKYDLLKEKLGGEKNDN